MITPIITLSMYPTCSVPGCERLAKARGMCFAHDQRVRKGRSLNAPLRQLPRMSEWCSVEGCGAPSRTLGLCGGHYQRQKKGDLCPDLPVQGRNLPDTCQEPCCTLPHDSSGFCRKHYEAHRRLGTLPGDRQACSVEGCDRTALSKGLCGAHYQRLLIRGEAAADVPLRPRKGVGQARYIKKGYVWVIRRGHPNAADARGEILEHRLVASDFLGRPLLLKENVHHRNGNRLENTVGPCLLQSKCECSDQSHNLELWSKSQPSGQRVSDKIQWAREILSLYCIEKGVFHARG